MMGATVWQRHRGESAYLRQRACAARFADGGDSSGVHAALLSVWRSADDGGQN
jgi:hypothetical protein